MRKWEEKEECAEEAARTGTKDSRDAHNASLPALRFARHRRAGREPLRRFRSFGSITPQAPKKVRRPWSLRQHQPEAFGKGECAEAAARAGTKDSRDATQRIPTIQSSANHRAGREPLRRVRVFGSITPQAPIKVRRPRSLRQQKSEVFEKGGGAMWQQATLGRRILGTRHSASLPSRAPARWHLRILRPFSLFTSPSLFSLLAS